MSNFRVKFKKGDLEIEVESTDKDYVDKKVSELLAAEPAEQKQRSGKKKVAAKRATKPEVDDANSQINVPAIVDAINESDMHDSIEEYILKKQPQIGRIILCLKFAADVNDSPYLTTGQIEVITDQLGVKVLSRNSAATIKSNQKYFAMDSVRRPGAIVNYKLNRKGLDAFESLLKGEKLS